MLKGVFWMVSCFLCAPEKLGLNVKIEIEYVFVRKYSLKHELNANISI